MVIFDEAKHEYTENGKKLISCTQLMKKHGLAPNYDNVSQAVLSAKAERGSLIHQEIEEYIKKQVIGFTNELFNFANHINHNSIEILQSEIIVNNDIVAGTIDLILKQEGEIIVADIKTTSTLHKESISWQLSIYAYLSGLDIKRGQAYHFDKNGDLRVVEIALKPIAEVERLLECERNGELYQQELVIAPNLLSELANIESIIAGIEEHKKQAEETAKELRQAILLAMEENAVKSFENERLKLTYVEPSTRTTIDTARLKKELPNIAKDFEKITTTKASLRITLKGDEK